MRTELPPLPSDSVQQDDAGEVNLDRVIQDIDRRLKALEHAFNLLTVNNANRQVLWNGPVKGGTEYGTQLQLYLQQLANQQNAQLGAQGFSPTNAFTSTGGSGGRKR